jgi:hypothetical protein
MKEKERKKLFRTVPATVSYFLFISLAHHTQRQKKLMMGQEMKKEETVGKVTATRWMKSSPSDSPFKGTVAQRMRVYASKVAQ